MHNERPVDPDSLGGRMRSARKQRELSLTGMADKLGKDAGYLSKAETNGVRIPASLVRLYESALDLQIARPGELPESQNAQRKGNHARSRSSPGLMPSIIIHIDIHVHLEGQSE